VGADGTKVKAVTVCHLNTSAWSPGAESEIFFILEYDINAYKLLFKINSQLGYINLLS
jgi:hypothetical protein